MDRSSWMSRRARWGLCFTCLLLAILAWNRGVQFGEANAQSLVYELQDEPTASAARSVPLPILTHSKWWGWATPGRATPGRATPGRATLAISEVRQPSLLLATQQPLTTQQRSGSVYRITEYAPPFEGARYTTEFRLPPNRVAQQDVPIIDPQDLLLPPPSAEVAHAQAIIDITDIRGRMGRDSVVDMPPVPTLAEMTDCPIESQTNFDEVLQTLVESHGDELNLDPRGIVVLKRDRPEIAIPIRRAPNQSARLPIGPVSSSKDAGLVQELRRMSRLLDAQSADAEDQEDYEKADRLRSLAEHMRIEARALSESSDARLTRRFGARWAY